MKNNFAATPNMENDDCYNKMISEGSPVLASAPLAANDDHAAAVVEVEVESIELPRLLESLLFASERALSVDELKSFFPPEWDIAQNLLELQNFYKNRGFELVELNGKWSFRTPADLAPYLKRDKVVSRKLSRATVETLAIIAYHQPVTRAEIEEIRGVSVAQGTLDILLAAGWIKPGRRRETPGRPVTWLSTDEFLQHFGIAAIEDLPGFDELKLSGLLDKNRPAPLFAKSDDALPPVNDADLSDSEEL